MTYDKLIEETKFSRNSVARAIKRLKNEGRIQRVGAAKSGHWEVIDLS